MIVITEKTLSKFRRKSNIIVWLEDISNWDCYNWYKSSAFCIEIRLRIINLEVGLIAMIEMYAYIGYE